MTKITIIGEEPKIKELKKIEFIKVLKRDLIISNSFFNTESFSNIELISLNYTKEFDLMFAYNSNRNKGALYLGKFNDGIV